VPYIVTTKREPQDDGMGRSWFEHVSRRAVATLEKLPGMTESQMVALKEHGGTVGPLPDGTMIEVEQTTWADLALALGWLSFDGGSTEGQQRLLDAYNARQA
jgi:hypothetical protein